MGRPERVSFKNGHSPAWNPKKGPSGVLELFYSEAGQAPKHRMMAVDVTPGPPLRIGTPRELFPFSEHDLLGFIDGYARGYDVSPDGQRFYIVQSQAPPPKPVVTHINLIENWFAELKAKVK